MSTPTLPDGARREQRLEVHAAQSPFEQRVEQRLDSIQDAMHKAEKKAGDKAEEEHARLVTEHDELKREHAQLRMELSASHALLAGMVRAQDLWGLIHDLRSFSEELGKDMFKFMAAVNELNTRVNLNRDITASTGALALNLARVRAEAHAISELLRSSRTNTPAPSNETTPKTISDSFRGRTPPMSPSLEGLLRTNIHDAPL
jgi:hypothetical protein